MRIGTGYDVHAFEQGRKLIIGGVEIPHERGLAGHSDADVLLHAITDAMLGALALGDIGKLYPDSSADFKDIDSRILLRDAFALIKSKGYAIGNLDAVIVAQRPKMAPYIDAMRENVAGDLETETGRISIKATTTERLGFEGREEGISSQAVVLLVKASEL
ncbi:MAG: 2-C-methyl-D-erythritol 2,4-cyclodiphosphate synthase [Proteocatella sp.]|jgi:2-C-methyl-D-erythritol 2,4-cyclodiphosphate synthase|nr:2-C-methyl-D-erythritol 2,4-cyclodiphosphate synthase [Proteocatella sp.]NCB71719.1 2-C-methyl-D-erythritol 2,4-cyclodiphosphate synthase [Clostridia bacterium]MBP7907725.1 2-C-methyl-D-erythritol 2,4-cyclodiphosphate synthase [Proteocatella sp.]MBP7913158.1 2-C-methyl-D-erythritol 2,4-cyclodiphosphate synthase [Proteocatella sp.]MBP8653600.1 2-C-methyl-D-erythritol 2,4-cyclodiphosphate synthase [Proteocatella sp.]